MFLYRRCTDFQLRRLHGALQRHSAEQHEDLSQAIMIHEDAECEKRFVILILEVIAEATMSPIAHCPMPSSLPAAR